LNGRTQRPVAAVADKDFGGGASEAVREERVEVEGLTTRYLTAGGGPPLLLLHGVGDDASDWLWAMALLARGYRVYAPDLPGSGGSAGPPAERYSPAFFGGFVGAFLDAVGVDRAAVIGNSLGGLAALRFALSEPERAAALGLVASAGLGRSVNPALRSLALPGCGGLAVAWGKTRPGAAQRVLGRSALVFSRPWRAPREWLKGQYRLARLPGFLEAQLATARSQVGLKGQREVLLDRLPELEAPTLVVWGDRDRVLSPSQAREAMARLRNGTLELVPDCGHLPQVEQPERFVSTLARFFDEKAR
jgi:pimeloyl-ACP methyl ester carboxylesterase